MDTPKLKSVAANVQGIAMIQKSNSDRQVQTSAQPRGMANKFLHRIGLLFFFLMLVLPTTYQKERGALLLIIVAGCLCEFLMGKWKIHPTVFNVGIICVTTSLFFIIYGLYNNAPGALSVGTVYVLWPLLFIFFMGFLNNPAYYEGFIKMIIVGVIVSAVMGILLVLEGFGFIDINLSSFLEVQGAGFGIDEGTLVYNLYNMTTIIFGFPFLLALIFLPPKLSVVNKFWNYLALFALVLALFTLLISRRRAFWVISLASPLIIYVIFRISRLANPFKLKPLFYVIVLASFALLIWSVVFKLSIENTYYAVLAGFDFGDSFNFSTSARTEQFHVLLDGWMNNPLMGSGHGAAALGSVRSDEQAWAYELSYLALLFQVGLIGLIVYSSAVLWIFVKSIRLVRTNPESAAMLLPLLVGLACFLIANATNPYLAKFDYLWTIFLPVGILNAYLLKISS
jgi:hypothetical protein